MTRTCDLCAGPLGNSPVNGHGDHTFCDVFCAGAWSIKLAEDARVREMLKDAGNDRRAAVMAQRKPVCST